MSSNGSGKTIAARDLGAESRIVKIEPQEVRNYDSGPTHYTVERSDDLDLKVYVASVMRRKYLVAAVTIILSMAAALFLLTRPSVYQASTRVQVDYENNGGIADTRDEPTTFNDRAYFNTQLELLTSPTLIKRALKKLDQTGAPEIGRKEAQPLSVSSLVRTALAAGTVADASGQSVQTDTIEDQLSQRVEAIKASLTVEPVIKTRQAIKDTRLIDITFRHPDPAICPLITNALADELVEMNLEKKLGANSTENEFLRANIAELTEKIRRDEQQLVGYGRNYQLPTLDGSQNTVVERLVGLNRQLLEAENERKQAEAAYRASQDPAVANTMAEMGSKEIAEIDNKLDELRQRRAQLLVEVTEKYPDVRVIDKEIAVLEQQAGDRRSRAAGRFTKGAETQYRQALAREDAIRRSFDEQRGATMQQNEAAINYKIIQQSLETNRKLLDAMTQRSTENEMLRAKVPNNIGVVDHASVPTDPVDNKTLQFLAIAFIFSLSAGVGLALLRDYFDNADQSVEKVEKALSSPALAVVPGASKGLFGTTRRTLSPGRLEITGHSDAPITVSGGDELILNSDGRSDICEAYRRLRTALLLSPSFGDWKRLLVTSSRKGEGKTTTSINIATSLAQSGVRVLLIDADLRNPRLGDIFAIGDLRGLAETISDPEYREGDILDRVVPVMENLDVLPSGGIDDQSAECLSSGRFESLLDELSSRYDRVIVDSPPVTNFADSTVIASMVDGVLMVVQAGRNSEEAVKHSAKLLRMVGGRIMGVVLNKAHMSPEAYYSPYSY